MDRAEAIKKIDWFATWGSRIEDTLIEDKDVEAFQMAIAALREQEQKSPCFLCGYGGKHLDAPPCTKCPAHPREQESNAIQRNSNADNALEWVSVKERLPEKDTLVLCIGAKGGLFVGKNLRLYEGENVAYCYVPNSRISRNATHWMPLPEPPKEGADHAD